MKSFFSNLIEFSSSTLDRTWVSKHPPHENGATSSTMNSAAGRCWTNGGLICPHARLCVCEAVHAQPKEDYHQCEFSSRRFRPQHQDSIMD